MIINFERELVAKKETTMFGSAFVIILLVAVDFSHVMRKEMKLNQKKVNGIPICMHAVTAAVYLVRIHWK